MGKRKGKKSGKGQGPGQDTSDSQPQASTRSPPAESSQSPPPQPAQTPPPQPAQTPQKRGEREHGEQQPTRDPRRSGRQQQSGPGTQQQQPPRGPQGDGRPQQWSHGASQQQPPRGPQGDGRPQQWSHGPPQQQQQPPPRGPQGDGRPQQWEPGDQQQQPSQIGPPGFGHPQQWGSRAQQQQPPQMGLPGSGHPQQWRPGAQQQQPPQRGPPGFGHPQQWRPGTTPQQPFPPRGPQGDGRSQQWRHGAPPQQQRFPPTGPEGDGRSYQGGPRSPPQQPPPQRGPQGDGRSKQRKPKGKPQEPSSPVQTLEDVSVIKEGIRQLPLSAPGQPKQQQRDREKTEAEQGAVPKQRAQTEPHKEESPPPTGEGDALRRTDVITPGTKGRRIRVEVNHVALKIGNIISAYHYDVSIVPDTPKSMLRNAVKLFGSTRWAGYNPAFDGRKNLYSAKLLPIGDVAEDKVTVTDDNRGREFEIKVKLVREVDLSPLRDLLRTKRSPQDALQCLDIVLRNAPANTCITAGRCFFTQPSEGRIINLGDGMDMYYGFYQSAIRGWKPLLNIDVAHKAFPSSKNVLDIICELGSDYRTEMKRDDLKRSRLDDRLLRTFEKYIKTLKVEYVLPDKSSKKYRVNGLGDSARSAKFRIEGGPEKTVEQYFSTEKGYRLQYPELPTLWVGQKDRTPKILLPVEFCTVVSGQVVNRKMTETQTSNMIKQAATSTGVRKDKIMTALRAANYNNDPCVREFGFNIGSELEKLDARVLNPPTLMYNNNGRVIPSRGVWRFDNKKFLKGAAITKWTIACVTRQPARMDRLADEVYKTASHCGLEINAKAQPPFQHIRAIPPEIIKYFNSKKDFDLIFVVVPNSGREYGLVKQAAELNVGCLTQCIKERTLFRLNIQTVINILLKVNSKLNGTNHRLDIRPSIMNRPCMLMGADVTHPSPDSRDIPSVAAVTASHDPNGFQYNICWRLQPPKVEIIEDLCAITIEQLKFFHLKTGYKPERIIFFRDGVSEGQFEQVQRAEIRAIQRACKTLQKEDYEPKITFLVVQKRHHTRLFPVNPKDSEDRNMNVPAGTCVDTTITNPLMQDFYLVSHASIQGVAKPTKYCTLWDDNNMSHDDIQELAYFLCHMFTRCNRSVSYPAPTYYAHLAAARAKVYIENERLNMEQLRRHQESFKIQDSICKGKPMFFV